MPFVKGQSGNPGGRPIVPDEVRDLARAHTETAIDRLAFWLKSQDAKASIAAANALLNRAWGMPTQPLSGDNGAPIGVVVQYELPKNGRD